MRAFYSVIITIIGLSKNVYMHGYCHSYFLKDFFKVFEIYFVKVAKTRIGKFGNFLGHIRKGDAFKLINNFWFGSMSPEEYSSALMWHCSKVLALSQSCPIFLKMFDSKKMRFAAVCHSSSRIFKLKQFSTSKHMPTTNYWKLFP